MGKPFEIDEVRRVISDNRTRYIRLLNSLKGEFVNYSQTPPMRDKIYRIYSRIDKGYDEIKAA
jgi:hypothetical protein